MEFDSTFKNKLLSLPDDQLTILIRQISGALGADRQKTDAFVNDLPSLRVMFSKMSPKDAEKLLSIAGREKSEEILKIITGQK